MSQRIVDLARDLAPAAVIGVIVGVWTALGVWLDVMVVSPGGMVGTGVGCAFVGAVLLDIFRGNV